MKKIEKNKFMYILRERLQQEEKNIREINTQSEFNIFIEKLKKELKIESSLEEKIQDKSVDKPNNDNIKKISVKSSYYNKLTELARNNLKKKG